MNIMTVYTGLDKVRVRARARVSSQECYVPQQSVKSLEKCRRCLFGREGSLGFRKRR